MKMVRSVAVLTFTLPLAMGTALRSETVVDFDELVALANDQLREVAATWGDQSKGLAESPTRHFSVELANSPTLQLVQGGAASCYSNKLECGLSQLHVISYPGYPEIASGGWHITKVRDSNVWVKSEEDVEKLAKALTRKHNFDILRLEVKHANGQVKKVDLESEHCPVIGFEGMEVALCNSRNQSEPTSNSIYVGWTNFPGTSVFLEPVTESGVAIISGGDSAGQAVSSHYSCEFRGQRGIKNTRGSTCPRFQHVLFGFVGFGIAKCVFRIYLVLKCIFPESAFVALVIVLIFMLFVIGFGLYRLAISQSMATTKEKQEEKTATDKYNADEKTYEQQEKAFKAGGGAEPEKPEPVNMSLCTALGKTVNVERFEGALGHLMTVGVGFFALNFMLGAQLCLMSMGHVPEFGYVNLFFIGKALMVVRLAACFELKKRASKGREGNESMIIQLFLFFASEFFMFIVIFASGDILGRYGADFNPQNKPQVIGHFIIILLDNVVKSVFAIGAMFAMYRIIKSGCMDTWISRCASFTPGQVVTAAALSHLSFDIVQFVAGMLVKTMAEKARRTKYAEANIANSCFAKCCGCFATCCVALEDWFYFYVACPELSALASDKAMKVPMQNLAMRAVRFHEMKCNSWC